MPPHPGSFIHKDIYRKVGLYNEKFTIAGDFDFFVKCFLIYNIKFKIMNLITTRMRIGGISTKNIFSNINNYFEIFRADQLGHLPDGAHEQFDERINRSISNHQELISSTSWNSPHPAHLASCEATEWKDRELKQGLCSSQNNVQSKGPIS